MLDTFLQDLRLAARRLAKSGGLTALVVTTLALGIGATTAIFSVVYGILLRPLPFPHPDRLVAVWEINSRGTYSRLADPNFSDFHDRSRSFEAMARYGGWVASVVGPAGPTRASIAAVSKDFFGVLGARPVLGRSLTAEDARAGAAPVVLVSDRYRRECLLSAPDFSAVKLRIGDRLHSVVGVLPEGFAFPEGTDLWVPRELDPDNPSRTSHNAYAIARLRPGVTAVQASAELALLAGRIVEASPERNEYLMRSATAVPLVDSMTKGVRAPLVILLGAVGFLLFVACANVVNLLLAEAAKRGRELAIRSSLGAGRGRLVRQFVTEALLLSASSGALGVALAAGLLRVLLALAPEDLPRLQEVTIRWPVLLFAAGISLFAALALGVVTAARAASGAPGRTLVESGRGTVGTARGQRVGRVIMGAQIATTLALLTGAGLLGRSLQRVLSVEPGFRTDDVVAMDLQLPDPDGSTPGARERESQLVSRLVERLHALPGAQEVAAVSALPMDGGYPDGMFLLVQPNENPTSFEGVMPLVQQVWRRGNALFCAATPDYFAALGIRLVRGRLFERSDSFDAPHVAVVSESLARSRWPDRDPVGQTIQFGNMDGDLHLLTVVGVVADTHESGLEQAPSPVVYVNLLQRPRSAFSMVIHTTAAPGSLIPSARALVRAEAPDVAPRFRTFAQVYSASLGPRRFNLTLVGVFALTALLLAVAGVYGVVSYGVAQRTQELGVRMALGATPRDVLDLVLRQGMATTLAGVAVGLVGSFATARAIQSLLFGVAPTDPPTFAAVVAGLVGVSALACWIPAHRATRVNPVVALRHE